jgi:hypothetical protein
MTPGVAQGPLILSGGRNCVENVTDLFMHVNADGLAGRTQAQPTQQNDDGSRPDEAQAWRTHSLSYVHNLLWRGDPLYRFDSKINDSSVFATQGYTTLIQVTPLIPYLTLEASSCLNSRKSPSYGCTII